MPLPKDIAEYLEDQAIGTVGTNIFVGHMPDSPDVCIAVYPYAGEPAPVEWEGEFPRVQIRVRDDDYATGWATSYAIFEALHQLTETTIETELYHYIEALGSPEQIGRDNKNRINFVLNFRVTKTID